MGKFGWSLPAGCGRLPSEGSESEEKAVDELLDALLPCLDPSEAERLEDSYEALIAAFWASRKAGEDTEGNAAAMAAALGPVINQKGLENSLLRVAQDWDAAYALTELNDNKEV